VSFRPDLGPCLYDLTGDIKDINTMLVNRAKLRTLLPWHVKLAIRWRNYRTFRDFRKFRLNL
jgi:hypothetical protein